MIASGCSHAPRALVAAIVGGCLWAGAAQANQTQWTTALSGPGAGSGSATITIDAGPASVCYELTVTLDPPANNAHIHRGGAGENGPIVVPLEAPSTGSASGCRDAVDAAVIAEIVGNPAGFYVNVHNPAFPGGAIRGQLAP